MGERGKEASDSIPGLCGDEARGVPLHCEPRTQAPQHAGDSNLQPQVCVLRQVQCEGVSGFRRCKAAAHTRLTLLQSAYKRPVRPAPSTPCDNISVDQEQQMIRLSRKATPRAQSCNMAWPDVGSSNKQLRIHIWKEYHVFTLHRAKHTG